MISSDNIISHVEEMAIKAGFDFDKPDPRLAWDIFKEFASLEVECTEDMILFQCGVYDFAGEDLFHLDFVRQFSFFDEDGEYDHMDQFHFTIFYKPCKELEGLEMNKWSEDFSSIEEYFKYIESMPSFTVPIEKYTPLRSELDYEEA